jgi:hypothetical protein
MVLWHDMVGLMYGMVQTLCEIEHYELDLHCVCMCRNMCELDRGCEETYIAEVTLCVQFSVLKAVNVLVAHVRLKGLPRLPRLEEKLLALYDYDFA